MNRSDAIRSLEFAKEYSSIIEGPRSTEASEKFEPRKQELETAVAWFTENSEFANGTLLASLLWRFWMDKGHVKEGRQLIDRLLKSFPAEEPETATFGEILYGGGMLAFRQADNKEAERLFQECLAYSRRAANKKLTVRALTGLSRAALRDGNFELVRTRSSEARNIAKGLGDEYLGSRPLHMLAAATKMEGDLKGAMALYEESLALSRLLNDVAMESTELDNLGSVALQMGDVRAANDWYRQAGELMYKQRDMYLLPYLPLHFGMVALKEGRFDRAVKLLGASEILFESAGMSPDPDEIGERDRTVSTLRTKVDGSSFSRHWAEGRKLSLDEAVHYALEK